MLRIPIQADDLGCLAGRAAAKWGIEKAEVMLRFYCLGIPAASGWATFVTPNFMKKLERIIVLYSEFGRHQELVWAIIERYPLFANHKNFLVQSLKIASPAFSRFLQDPDRMSAMKSLILGSQEPLIDLPIKDLEKAIVLQETFGIEYLKVHIGKNRRGVFSVATEEGLLSHLFKNLDTSHDSAVNEFLDMVAFLAKKQSESLIMFMSRDVRNGAGQTLLMKYIEQRPEEIGCDEDGLRFIIAHSNVNDKDILGETALFRAVENGNIDVIQLLLESGANTFVQIDLG